MALLSLIIPVFRVEKYLAACLDSVLAQHRADVEIVAVDDASDDGSSAILASYAQQHPGITVVSLDRNGGLGAARNAGIAHASGRYVWCVDSDDWLPDGSLAAVADRLEHTDPDLLITGYSRVHPDGRAEEHPVTGIAPGRQLPEVFRFADEPGLLDVLWIACNKIIKRDRLVDTGITFQSGWYEDVSFVIPLLVAVDRIAVLDRDCYAYRQHHDGAITRTVSDRHFEVFDQWQRVFTYLDAHPGRAAALRPLIFGRMIWHCLQVLGHPHRVPRSHRRRYFRRTYELYHRHRPVGGYQVPGNGSETVKHRLVAANAYSLYQTLMAVWSLRKRLPGRASGATGVSGASGAAGAGERPATAGRTPPAAAALPGTVPARGGAVDDEAEEGAIR
ncbi:glycosyltransferase family 2 protein [Solwaraspora sp. WMMA2065]|uniref:glycosyltransferase family 2 protein n=1 Tax=Solwaraspora sp. WMMA2065 TaxID=3015166 RepID=UPI00259B65F9|nr:glycosyltransferase family 2 protein [Solwaraspora sp. WMMA2065]WJK33379.1 glycosyltransferase family 2 protein [Solwaraspora sp. WMMA2065]